MPISLLSRLGATGLSCETPQICQRFRMNSGLARLSQSRWGRPFDLSLIPCVILCLSSYGCLFSGPPEFEQSTKTTPVLNYNEAVPSITRILDARTGDSIAFKVPFQSQDFSSQDDRELVEGVLLLDYNLVDQDTRVGGPTLMDPDVFARKREMEVRWSVDAGLKGCHQISLLVGHRSNFDSQTHLPKLSSVSSADMASRAGIAIAVWWVNVNPNADQPTLLECPPVGAAP